LTLPINFALLAIKPKTKTNKPIPDQLLAIQPIIFPVSLNAVSHNFPKINGPSERDDAKTETKLDLPLACLCPCASFTSRCCQFHFIFDLKLLSEIPMGSGGRVPADGLPQWQPYWYPPPFPNFLHSQVPRTPESTYFLVPTVPKAKSNPQVTRTLTITLLESVSGCIRQQLSGSKGAVCIMDVGMVMENVTFVNWNKLKARCTLRFPSGKRLDILEMTRLRNFKMVKEN
jgi:hypothetical protein